MSSRADRLVGRLPDAGVDVLLVTGVCQRPLPHRLHRQQRHRAGRAATRGCSSPTFATSSRRPRRSTRRSSAGARRRNLLEAVGEVLPAPASCGSGSRPPTCPCASTRRLRERLPDRIELVGIDGLVEGLRAVKEPERGGRDQGRRGARGRGVRRAHRRRPDRAYRARAGAAARVRDAPARRRAARASTRSSPAARTARCRTPGRATHEVRARRARRDRLGSAARRLLLGLHEDARHRRDRRRGRGRLPARAGRPARGLEDVAAGCRRAGSRRGRARRDHGRRPRGALRPRARPRRRARGPRGAPAGAALGGRAGAGKRGHGRAGRVHPGRFGVRIEDLVVVTDDGCEILTSISKEPHGRRADPASTLVAVRRTEQRRAAIWALYQSDLLGRPLEQTFPRDAHAFTRALAELVRDHQPELDELIRDARERLVARADRAARALDPAGRPGRAAVPRDAARRAGDPARGGDRRGGRDRQAVLRRRGARRSSTGSWARSCAS